MYANQTYLQKCYLILKRVIKLNTNNESNFGKGYNNFSELLQAAANEKSYYKSLKKIDLAKNKHKINEILLSDGTFRKQYLVSWKKKLIAAAAFIILLLCTYFFIALQSERNYYMVKEVAVNHQKNITLPDGSLVTLNNGSVLEYVDKLYLKKREVNLTGEAFFNVEADKQNAFLINVESVLIEVVGTSFNVKSFENKYVKISVLSGVVKVFGAANKTDYVFVNAGEFANVNTNSGLIELGEIVKDSFLNEGTANLTFKNEELEQVFNRLSKVFGTEIIVEKKSILKYKYTSNCIDQNLEDILEELKILHNINYQIINNKVYVK